MLLRKYIKKITQRVIKSDYQLDSTKRFFLITSHGQTASMWLAGVLNKFPEIFCTHGYSYPPIAARLDELTHDDIKLRDLSAERFEKITIPSYLRELAEASQCKVTGNVLAFYLGRLLAKVTSHELKHNHVRVINVIRHPLMRINSTLKTWDPDGKGEVPPFVAIDFEYRAKHIVEFINQNYIVDYEALGVKSFIVALLAMEDIARDVVLAERNNIPNMRYEEITQQLESFIKLIDHLSSGMIVDRNKIEEVFHSKKINAHHKNGSTHPKEQYDQWAPWQQAAYSYVVRRKKIDQLYSKYHYTLLF